MSPVPWLGGGTGARGEERAGWREAGREPDAAHSPRSLPAEIDGRREPAPELGVLYPRDAVRSRLLRVSGEIGMLNGSVRERCCPTDRQVGLFSVSRLGVTLALILCVAGCSPEATVERANKNPTTHATEPFCSESEAIARVVGHFEALGVDTGSWESIRAVYDPDEGVWSVFVVTRPMPGEHFHVMVFPDYMAYFPGAQNVEQRI